MVNGCDGKVWVGVADTNIYKRENVVALLSRQYVTIIQLRLRKPKLSSTKRRIFNEVTMATINTFYV